MHRLGTGEGRAGGMARGLRREAKPQSNSDRDCGSFYSKALGFIGYCYYYYKR